MIREGVFDAILLISVLHHIPVEQRRINCIKKCLIISLPKLSYILIVVWAKEQRQFLAFPSSDVS
uniref:Methyltransf_11 domain-containing protein n=1 Tax=Meloidogyne hapla TaxID=6305 RepID=A0A1I8BB59_MELHA